MAEEDNVQQKEKTEPVTHQLEAPESKNSLGVYLWLIISAIILAGTAGGFALAQFITGSGPAKVTAAEKDPDQTSAQNFEQMLESQAGPGKEWYYELETVMAHLDEPGVSRRIRCTITLELTSAMNQEKGTAFLKEKSLLLKDCLTRYLAGLSLERTRGSRNISRIKNEIKEEFNRTLFSNSKPYIDDVLLNEFIVQ